MVLMKSTERQPTCLRNIMIFRVSSMKPCFLLPNIKEEMQCSPQCILKRPISGLHGATREQAIAKTIFADRGCRVVSAMDPYGRILAFSTPKNSSATLVQIYRINRSHSSILKMETIALPKHWNPFIKLHGVKSHHFDKFNKFPPRDQETYCSRSWNHHSVNRRRFSINV
jgi:hypothetical protein